MSKEKLNYYDEFIKCVGYSIKCAELLSNVLQNFSKETLPQSMKEMHSLEHLADDVKHHVTSYLLRDFLPPIEREDIVVLSHKIDNLTDNIEDILIKIDIYNVTNLRPEITELIALLAQISISTYKLIEEFKQFTKSKVLKDLIIKINHLEEDGDSLYAKYMRKLYSEVNDAKEIIIWTEIFNSFEQCFDSCEQISDTIETIVLKNS